MNCSPIVRADLRDRRRYGRSPLWVRRIVKQTVADFSSLYSPSFVSAGAFSSLSSFASALNLTEAAATTALEYFDKNGIAPLFTKELIAAATTVNCAPFH